MLLCKNESFLDGFAINAFQNRSILDLAAIMNSGAMDFSSDTRSTILVQSS